MCSHFSLRNEKHCKCEEEMTVFSAESRAGEISKGGFTLLCGTAFSHVVTFRLRGSSAENRNGFAVFQLNSRLRYVKITYSYRVGNKNLVEVKFTRCDLWPMDSGTWIFSKVCVVSYFLYHGYHYYHYRQLNHSRQTNFLEQSFSEAANFSSLRERSRDEKQNLIGRVTTWKQ